MDTTMTGQRSLHCEVDSHPCFLGNHNVERDLGCWVQKVLNVKPCARPENSVTPVPEGRGNFILTFQTAKFLSICDYAKQGCQLGCGIIQMELLTLCSWRKGLALYLLCLGLLLKPKPILSIASCLGAWLTCSVLIQWSVMCHLCVLTEDKLQGGLAFASDVLSGPQNSCNAKESYG